MVVQYLNLISMVKVVVLEEKVIYLFCYLFKSSNNHQYTNNWCRELFKAFKITIYFHFCAITIKDYTVS